MFKKTRLTKAVMLLAMLFIAATTVFWGCTTWSDDIPTGAPVTVEGLIEDGWSDYGNGNFVDAVNAFNDAANADAKNLEAYLGMGYAFAQLNELIRAHQNFSNVVALSDVLEDEDPSEGGITPETADDLRAESYAGMAVAYLAEREFEDAVDMADEALALDASFEHRWIDGFDHTQIKIVKAEAYFGSEDYANCMYILDDISGNFISGSQQIQEATDTLEVTLLEDTWSTGIAELELTTLNLIVPEIVVAYGDDARQNPFEVISYESSGNIMQFKANPIPQPGDMYEVEYKYAQDFGEFLIELRDKIDALRL